jgi:hypothetical protein
LTPLPVAHGTGGFAAALSTAQSEGRTYYLSLAGYRRALATEEKMDAEEETPGVEEDLPVDVEEPVAEGDSGSLAQVLEVLRAHGLVIPREGTTPENLMERIMVAGHAKMEGEGEEEEFPEEEGPAVAGGQTQEEQRPVMLSLATARTPTERALLQREQARHRSRLLSRIDRLTRRGMSVATANAFRERANGYTLALTEEGGLVDKRLDRDLATWEEATAGRHFARTVLGRSRPEPRPTIEPDASEMEIQERASRFSVNPKR